MKKKRRGIETYAGIKKREKVGLGLVLGQKREGGELRSILEKKRDIEGP